MTCIVGLCNSDSITIGGDSAFANNDISYAGSQSKVIRVGPCLIGYAGCTRFGELLEHALIIPEKDADQDVRAWMTLVVSPTIRDLINRHHLVEKMSDETHGTALIGAYGRLFRLQNDLSVVEPSEKYLALGSGSHLATGALHALSKTGSMSQRGMALAALETAAYHSPFVRGPFVVISMAATFCR